MNDYMQRSQKLRLGLQNVQYSQSNTQTETRSSTCNILRQQKVIQTVWKRPAHHEFRSNHQEMTVETSKHIKRHVSNQHIKKKGMDEPQQKPLYFINMKLIYNKQSHTHNERVIATKGHSSSRAKCWGRNDASQHQRSAHRESTKQLGRIRLKVSYQIELHH